VEVCIVLRKLERLDKDEFSEDERADAEEVYNFTTMPLTIGIFFTQMQQQRQEVEEASNEN
jgi:hypothetical protein